MPATVLLFLLSPCLGMQPYAQAYLPVTINVLERVFFIESALATLSVAVIISD